MSSLNKVMLIGNLGRDPEIRSTQTGDRIATLSLATSERWKDKQSGEQRERTEWHRVVVFNSKLVDVAERYLVKGSKLYIEGKLQTRKWQAQDGSDRWSTEIVLHNFDSKLVMLNGRRDGAAGDSSSSEPDDASGVGGAAASGVGTRQPTHPDLDDEIPF